MKNKILTWLDTTAGRLIFALAAGVAYYIILLRWIIEWSRGLVIIAASVAPVIICGAAIIIIKLMKQAKEDNNDTAIFRLFILHVILFIISMAFLAAMFV
ncbi:MAG: hypothetical protein IJH94_03885 [Clostridia bacterium]|nr:hypothetical protein [Clostridia bacterium]